MSSPLGLDSAGMWEATAALPEQVAAAANRAAEIDAGSLPRSETLTGVVAVGMGGSAVAGDLLAAAAWRRSPVPVAAVKSFDLPSWVGPSTLVVAVSFSGDTEETLTAARQAWHSGAPTMVVSGGGELSRLAADAGALLVEVPAGIPESRAALGALAVPPLLVLEQLGLLPGAGAEVVQAVEQLERRRDELVDGAGPAARVASRIGRTIPLVHGGTGFGAVAARRWKAQVNQNAKAPAFWASQPELCHDEIAGWGQHGDVTRQLISLVSLRHGGDHPAVVRRMAVVADILEEVVATTIEVVAAGDGDVAQFFDLALVGDFVSLHLAGREGVDPGPVPALADVTERLRA